MSKECSECHKKKDSKDFYTEHRNKDGLTSACKECILSRQKEYAASHKISKAAYLKEYVKNHKSQIEQYKKEYYLKNKENCHNKYKKYYAENRDKIVKCVSSYTKARRAEDPLFAYSLYTRYIINTALRSGNGAPRKAEKLLGCTLEIAREHLLDTWEKRYGKKYNGEEYQIDHIVPLSYAESADEVDKLAHFTNLQMLTPNDNMIKGKKVIL